MGVLIGHSTGDSNLAC